MITLGLLVACFQGPNLDGDAGFQGTVFSQSWARVSASIFHDGESIDAELRFTLRSGLQEPVVYRRPLPLGRKARMRIGQDIFLSGRESEVDVELWSKGTLLKRTPVLLNFVWGAEHRLLVVGPMPEVLDDGLGKKTPVTLARTTPELFPASLLPLTAVDTIVLAEPIDLTTGQEDALRQWVTQGGRLIFFAGRSTLLRQHPLWREWCPIDNPAVAAVPVPGKSPAETVTMLRGTLRKGVALQSLGAEPALIRSSQGSGQINFFTFMADQPKVRSLFSGKTLVPVLLDFPPPPKEEPKLRRPVPGFPAPGPGRLVTQELENIFSLLLPWESPLLNVPLDVGGAIGVIYILLLGPWQYVRLKRMGRLRKGWLPFGILVLVTIPVVLVWGGAFNPRPSRLELLELWDEDRVQCFGVLRPTRGDTFQMTASGALTPLPPERAFGARDPGTPIRVEHPATASLPIPPNDSRSFLASRPLRSDEPVIRATWKDRERRSVRLYNPGSVYLKESWVLSNERVWSAGPLAGGATRDLELSGGEPLKSYVRWVPPRGEKGDPRASYFPKWDGLHGPAIAGLALSFYEKFQLARESGNDRYQVVVRGLDLSPGLARGELYFVASFDQDVSGIRIDPAVAPTVYGWVRARIQEAKP